MFLFNFFASNSVILNGITFHFNMVRPSICRHLQPTHETSVLSHIGRESVLQEVSIIGLGGYYSSSLKPGSGM